jgi:hypothetical protein
LVFLVVLLNWFVIKFVANKIINKRIKKKKKENILIGKILISKIKDMGSTPIFLVKQLFINLGRWLSG